MMSSGGNQRAIRAADAKQTFVEHGLAALRIGDRLIGEQDAPLVQRGDDPVGGEDIGAADRLALDIRRIGEKRAGTLFLGAVENFLRA